MLRSLVFCLILQQWELMKISIGDPKKIPVIDNISDFLTSPWEILEPVVRDEFD